MGKSALAITDDHRDLADAANGQLSRLSSRAAARATLDAGRPGRPPRRPLVGRRRRRLAGSGNRRGVRRLGVRPGRIGGGAGGTGPRTVPRPVPAHRGGRGGDRPVRTRFGSGATASGTGRRQHGGRARPVGQRRVGSDLVPPVSAPAVLGAPDADVLVVVAGDDVVAGRRGRRRRHRHRAAVAGHHPQRRVGGAARRRRRPRTACCAAQRGAPAPCSASWRPPRRSESVGPTLDMAVEYAKVREQFGRTIGTFQAVKHHAANMLVNAEQTTAATWDAARADDLDSAWFAGAVAASHAIRTQIFNAQSNIQLHGGIGFTWEHDAHLYLRRARTLAALMSDGADPLLDVVEAQRSGQAHGASFTLPDEAEEYRTAAREAVATWRRCPRRSGATSSSTPAIWCRTGRKPWGRAAGRARAVGDRGGVRRRRAARHGHHRLGDADHRPGGHRRPARALGRARAARAGDVVPAVLRARRGFGRRRGAHAPPRRSTAAGGSPARRCGPAWRTSASGGWRRSAPIPTRPSTPA